MAVLPAPFLWPICVLGVKEQQETMRGAELWILLLLGRQLFFFFFFTVKQGRKTTNTEAHITISGTSLLATQFKTQTAKSFVGGCFCSF